MSEVESEAGVIELGRPGRLGATHFLTKTLPKVATRWPSVCWSTIWDLYWILSESSRWWRQSGP